MRPQIKQGTATCALHIPKPLRMRAEVLLALFDEVHFAERAGVCHLFRLDVFRGEQERLRIEQQHPIGAAGRDYLVRLVERDTKRLLANHMLARLRHRKSHFTVQGVGSSDADRFNLGVFGQLFVIVVDAGNLIAIGQSLCVRRGRGSDRYHRSIVWDHAHRGSMTIRLELRADDAHPHRIFHNDLFSSILKSESKTNGGALLYKFRRRLIVLDLCRVAVIQAYWFIPKVAIADDGRVLRKSLPKVCSHRQARKHTVLDPAAVLYAKLKNSATIQRSYATE